MDKKNKRNLYLENISVEDALEKYLTALKDSLVPGFETISVIESPGRITCSPVYAKCCSPLYNASAMDGIAVIASSTSGARESNPLLITEGKDFIFIDTGDAILPPWDAVIMAEDLIETNDDPASKVPVSYKIMSAASAWQNVRPIGEDIVTGEMILPGMHKIRPIDIGVLLSGGVCSIDVFTKPRVAVFPTGDEMVEPGEEPKAGEIIESNSRMFEASINQDGGRAFRFPSIPDDYDLLKTTIKKAIDEYDMVIINAGTSAGTEDHVVHVIRELGQVIVHGVAMKPGKPVILGMINNKPIIGTPGYPVSAWLSYQTFVVPVLSVLTGSHEQSQNYVEAILARRLVSSLKHKEYVRVKLGFVDGRLVASPLARGAGAAMSLVRADGFCIINQNSEGIEAGEKAVVKLSRPLEEIERSLVCIGSHDLVLDIIADMMISHGTGRNSYLASSHVGSMAGLMALKRGECHIAPTHLLDEDTGLYNNGWLRKIFEEVPVYLIKGFGRIQGLILPKSNPKGIRSIKDLLQCKYINRQKGAGTRLFLDFLLKKEGIDPESIDGYNREAATHMAVAAAVQGGSADAGMGIASAASALDLDFIPLGTEEYDFAVLPKFLDMYEIKVFLDIIKSETFHKRLKELGGYTWERAGEIVSLRKI